MANPFLTPSTLPYQLPPFAQIRDEHYAPAIEQGMREQLDEIAAITSNPEAPTFENTLVALERSGQTLTRVMEVFWSNTAALATPAIQAIDEEFSPKLSAHEDAIRLNSDLYARIKAVAEGAETLDAEARRLVERRLTEFTLAGAGLDESDKATLRELNEQLATLNTRFEKYLLAETNDLAVLFDTASDLDGLTEGEVSAAAAAATEAGHEGKFLITLVLPTMHPHLDALTKPESRARIYGAQSSRGQRGGDTDTRDLILQIVDVRARRARLLGYDNHAAAKLADTTAKDPARVMELLGKMAPAAARNARAEHADLEASAGVPVAASDWSFYAEQVRKEKFDVDFAAMRPYFELERVLHDGVFFAANKLFGLHFAEREDLVGYHPDVRVFEVTEEDGTPVGLYLFDAYTRSTKKGGAWMNSLVSQSALLHTPYAVVCNNLNAPKPAAGEPTLLTYDMTRTFFHEFGHALHGLLARVTYPHFSGTNVFLDFVEYPSQVNEMWMLDPTVLANYAVHHETGEPMPQELVDRLIASESFGQGFATSEYLAAALLDQAWHAIGPDEVPSSVDDFEAAALAKVGLDNPAVAPRYRSSYFAHAFSYGYDAGYFAYIWSEVLDADTVAWFTENGGLTRENGERYRTYIIGIGGAVDPLESYREFRGRDADLRHLLERRGLA